MADNLHDNQQVDPPVPPAQPTTFEYLTTTLAFSDAERVGIVGQGYENFVDVLQATDEELDDLGRVLCRPCGRIGNATNHGIAFSVNKVKKLKKLSYALRHLQRVFLLKLPLPTSTPTWRLCHSSSCCCSLHGNNSSTTFSDRK